MNAEGNHVNDGYRILKNPKEYSKCLENECLIRCIAYTKHQVFGCEYRWDDIKKGGCYVHLSPLTTKGNGRKNIKCAIMTKYGKITLIFAEKC